MPGAEEKDWALFVFIVARDYDMAGQNPSPHYINTKAEEVRASFEAAALSPAVRARIHVAYHVIYDVIDSVSDKSGTFLNRQPFSRVVTLHPPSPDPTSRNGLVRQDAEH